MSKSVCLVALAGLMFGASLAAQPTWRGQISDSSCGPKHTMGGMTSRACTEACVKSKAKYVFLFGGKVYQIADQRDKALATHAGHTVVLTGTMKDDTLDVSNIAMPNKK
jgi:hypothetical protein